MTSLGVVIGVVLYPYSGPIEGVAYVGVIQPDSPFRE